MLKKNYEFKNVLKERQYYGGRYVEMFTTNNHDVENFLGIAVSKKIANSVERNQIKRYIREAYRNIEEQIKTGYNIVIMWKKKAPVDSANYAGIKQDLLVLFKKADMLIWVVTIICDGNLIIMKRIIIFFIKVYKKTLSPYLHHIGIDCKYYPTCSEYAKQAVEKYGVLKGSFIALKRILRCNPFSKGGYDPLK